MRQFTILLILCMFFTLSQGLNAQNHSDYRMASEEAKLRASRNLIEKLFGAWLIVATEVRDFQLQRETIIVRVYGKLYGVQFSPVVHDRENGLLLVNAQISKTDALNALKASGYTGGGALPDYIQAEGAAPYEGQGLRPRVESYERPLSLASSIGELIFRKAEVKAPTDMKKWEEVLKMIGHYSKQQVIEEKEKETFYVEIRLPQTEIEYILSEAVSPTQFSEALKNTEKVFKKGILARCRFDSFSCIKVQEPKETGWYSHHLNPYYDLSLALTEQIQLYPSEDLIFEVKKGANLETQFSPATQEFKIELTLGRAEAELALLDEKALTPSQSKAILERIGRGVRLSLSLFTQ